MEASWWTAGSFYDQLSSRERIDLMACGRWRDFPPGKVLYRQGEPGGQILLVRRGLVKLTVTASGGQEIMLPIHVPGFLVGVGDALRGASAAVRAATASALVESVCVAINRKDLQALLNRHPRLWEVLARDLAVALGATEDRLTEMAFEDAGRRLARALLRLVNIEQIRPGEPYSISVPLTQADLASWLGTARETVERRLRDWRERGIITTGCRTIQILRIDDLARIAGVPLPESAETLDVSTAQPGAA